MSESFKHQNEIKQVISRYHQIFLRKLTPKQRQDLMLERNRKISRINQKYSLGKKRIINNSVDDRASVKKSVVQNSQKIEYSVFRPQNQSRILQITRMKIINLNRRRDLLIQQLRRRDNTQALGSESQKIRKRIFSVLGKSKIFSNIIRNKNHKLHSRLRILHNNRQYSLVNSTLSSYKREIEHVSRNYMLEMKKIESEHIQLKKNISNERKVYSNVMKSNNPDTQFHYNKMNSLRKNGDIVFENLNNISIKSQRGFTGLFDFQKILPPNVKIVLSKGNYSTLSKSVLMVNGLKLTGKGKNNTRINGRINLGGDRQSLSNITINAGNNERGISIKKNYCKLSNMNVIGGKFAVIIDNGLNTSLENINIRGAKIDGIQIKGSHGTKINNCVIKDFAKYGGGAHRDGIQIIAGTENKQRREGGNEIVHGITITNCRIEAPQGIMVTQAILKNAIISGNIIGASTDHGITVAGIDLEILNNRVYSFSNNNIDRDGNAAIKVGKSTKVKSDERNENKDYSVKFRNNFVDISKYINADKRLIKNEGKHIDPSYKVS